MSNPGDMILPLGWVEMYNEMLPKTIPPSNMTLQSHRQQALLLLVRSFCVLVKKVNDGEWFQHKFSGRIRARGQGIHIFARRNVHFLTTCVLNTHSWRSATGTFLNQTRALVDQVCTFDCAIRFKDVACFNYSSICRRLGYRSRCQI